MSLYGEIKKGLEEAIKYEVKAKETIESYKDVMDIVENYKNIACKLAGYNCCKCEAMFKYNGERHCQFDTVNRFIEWYNIYGKVKE